MAHRGTKLTPKQVARAIGVSESSVKRWCDNGLIETVRTSGGHRRLLLDSVQRFLKESGQSVVAPDVLGLPSTTGSSERILRRDCDLFTQALSTGDESVARQIIVDLHNANHSLSAILDMVLLRGMADIRKQVASSVNGQYRDQHAAEICLRVIDGMRNELPAIEPPAPSAIIAALDGAPDTVRVSAAELILCATGWNATSLGRLLPFATIIQAVEQQRTRICFIDVAVIRNEQELIRRFEPLLQAAAVNETAVAIGGDAISNELASRLNVDQFCADMGTLENWARALENSVSKSPRST